MFLNNTIKRRNSNNVIITQLSLFIVNFLMKKIYIKYIYINIPNINLYIYSYIKLFINIKLYIEY